MNYRFLLVPMALAALLGCASDSSISTSSTDSETLKGSPAGIAIFGLLDSTTTLPGLLGGSYPACVTSTVSGTTATLALAGCKSATGGTLAGTLTLADTPSGTAHSYVETFASLVCTRSSTLQWVYTGSITAAVNGTAGTLAANPGFKITVTDTAIPANSKVWNLTSSLASTRTSSGFTLAGTFAVTSGTTDSVSVQIDSAAPLTWVTGGAYPVTGKLVITDTRSSGTSRETVTAQFDHGTVTINGGVITLG